MSHLTPSSLVCMALVFGIWFVNELLVEFQHQTDSSTISKQAKQNNFWLVTGTGLCFVVFGIFLTLNLTGSHYGVIPMAALSYVGLFIACVGVVLRRYAIHTLKDNFDGIIQIKETQQLTTKGLYALVRHPSYTGSILFFIGFGLSSLNLITLILFTVFIFTIYHIRIQYEEDVLINAFGTQYSEYRNQTNPFFPHYKTIKQLGVKYYVQRSKNNL